MLLVSHMGAGTDSSSGGQAGSSSVQEALRGAFLEVDANLAASNIDCEFSGCTCAVAHLQVCLVWEDGLITAYQAGAGVLFSACCPGKSCAASGYTGHPCERR